MHVFVLHCSYEQNGWTALNAACKAGHISVAEKLVRHGSDVNKHTVRTDGKCTNEFGSQYARC
jgi:ankyrin repeat protein